MMSLPKSIKSNNLMREASYSNSVLQAFIQLECFQEWIKYLNNNNSINHPCFNTTLTKDLYLLFCCIANGNSLDSSKIILDYDSKSAEFYKKDISKDPYHFIFYFLNILHLENNIMPNPNFNLNQYHQLIINNARNDNQVFQLFINYFNQTNNSFISNNFYNIQKFFVSCNNCSCMMYSYDIMPILKFNCDELIMKRNQSDPLKIMKRLSLTDCFEVSLWPRKIRCRLCNSLFGNETKKMYAASNVLIIAFKRNCHSYNFRNDVKFYYKIDISKYIINQNSENKIFKLKAVVACYDYNKYLVDVFINGSWYRIVDWKSGLDVKMINFNQLFEYEPILLFYEIDYQGKLYEKMKKLQELQSFINAAQYLEMMRQNFMFSNSQQPNMGNNIDSTKVGFNLKFLVIPQNWNHDENDSFPICPQVTPDSTLKYAIEKFYTKLIKKKEAIIKFTYNNDIELNPNSEQKLIDLNINENTTIYAIKSPDFDKLDLDKC